jgi:chemotaxis signal transduction protein
VSENLTGVIERSTELRRAFDKSFSVAPVTRATDLEDLLDIRVGLDPYAIHLNQVTGVFADKPVTPLPGSFPELVGIAGFRGAIVPVYDLRILLGYPRGGSQRWLILTAGKTRIALAFDQFEGHTRVARSAIAEEGAGETQQHHVREVVRTANLVRPIVHLPSILEVIRKRARQGNL